jgi:hypothetical protein
MILSGACVVCAKIKKSRAPVDKVYLLEPNARGEPPPEAGVERTL